MTANLKSCPFCGGEAQARNYRNATFWVECSECEASIKVKDSAYDAAEAWNVRGPSGANMIDIFQRIAIDNGVTVEQIRSSSRLRIYSWPRQDGMLACRRAGYTYSEISTYLNRDHKTVFDGVKAAQKREHGEVMP